MKKIIITILIIYVAGVGGSTFTNFKRGYSENPFIWPQSVIKKVVKKYENN